MTMTTEGNLCERVENRIWEKANHNTEGKLSDGPISLTDVNIEKQRGR